METITLPTQNYNCASKFVQESPKNNQKVEKCTLTLDQQNMSTVAKIAGWVAAIFVLLQIGGILYEIFILEQRLLNFGEKGGCFFMIFFAIIKIGYTMTLIFYLFILSPENISTVKTTTFVIAAVQAGVSLYLIINEHKKYKNPDDPDTIANLWALMMVGVYALEFLIFIVMIGNFLVILFNTNEPEPEQKRFAAPAPVYYYVPQKAGGEALKAHLVAPQEV